MTRVLLALSLAMLIGGCGSVVTVSSGGGELVRTQGNASGPGSGSWRGERGMFEPYRHGAQFAVLFTIKNASGEPLTLIAADDPDSGHRLLQRVGVHFALVPEQSPEDAAHFAPGPGLSPPFGAVEPTPVTLPPGREAQIQFNFVMGDCQYFEPGQRETYNEQTTIHYRIGDNEKSSPIDLTGDQVTITAPAAADCPA